MVRELAAVVAIGSPVMEMEGSANADKLPADKISAIAALERKLSFIIMLISKK